jgi:hypothetical protein
MNKLAVVIASHQEAGKLDGIGEWISTQNGWSGPLIIVYSGVFSSSSLIESCMNNGVQLVVEESVVCGLAKRNRGAEIARELGSTYINFLTDYQSLAPGSIAGFEEENHNEAIVFGNVQFEIGSQINEPKISMKVPPLGSKSSISEIWAIFSSISESGMLIKLETFHELGAWQYPIRRNKVYLGGDGAHLLVRAFRSDCEFGYSPIYRVLGGHRNVNIDKTTQEARGALYPYAFTLSSKMTGLPRWIALRFIFGRFARMIQMLIRRDFVGALKTRLEIEARCRAYVGLEPSLKSKPLQNMLETNCEQSEFLCNSIGATQCRKLD